MISFLHLCSRNRRILCTLPKKISLNINLWLKPFLCVVGSDGTFVKLPREEIRNAIRELSGSGMLQNHRVSGSAADLDFFGTDKAA